MKNKKTPRLTLIGAGPGDPELITLKGVRALATADIVLYDALADQTLLDYAPRAEHIFVGKRKGRHSYSQEMINRMIVGYALSRGHVVRLKGGDPFVFGRGAEELTFAAGFGIETKVIPGVSSAIAVPASQGISLTRRGISESFWVLTGTTQERALTQDLRLAAQSTATVVILMGMGNLPAIVETFRELGKGDLPVAIIQSGTLPEEKTAVGTIDTIRGIVERCGIGSPAVIVVGEVVRHRLNALFKLKFSNWTFDLNEIVQAGNYPLKSKV